MPAPRFAVRRLREGYGSLAGSRDRSPERERGVILPTPQAIDWKTALHVPRAVAVIGASSNPQKIGGRTLSNLRLGGFSGEVYPINPAGGRIDEWQVFQNLADVPAQPDMAIIAVPGAEAVEAAIRDCVVASVKTCIVFSAGFRESGDQGHAHEARLIREARSRGLNDLHGRPATDRPACRKKLTIISG